MPTKEFNALDRVIAEWRLQKVVSLMRSDDVILDFGCGSQLYLLKRIAPRIHSGVGYDFDLKNKQIEKNISSVRARSTGRMPFKDSSFSKIILLAVLEHIELQDVNRIFAEFHRILKPSGQILITTPTPHGKILLECMAFKLRIISAIQIQDHKKYYTRTDILKLGRQSKLKLERYDLFALGANSFSILR